MFVGGIRALLLQSLHPLAMAGVAGHSGYRADPWGRLQRTSHFLATTTFGTVEAAEAAIATVRADPRPGPRRAEDGRPYAADDPHLLALGAPRRGRQLPAGVPAARPRAARCRRGRPVRRAERAGGVPGSGWWTRRGRWPSCTPGSRRSDPSWGPPPRPATPPGSCCCSRRCPCRPAGLRRAGRCGRRAAAAVGALAAGAARLPLTERLVVGAVGDAATGVIRWAMTSPEITAERRTA